MFALSGVVGYFAHSRFLTVIGVMAVALAVLGVPAGAIGRAVAAAAVAAMAVGVVLADLLVDHLASALNMADRESSEFSRIFRWSTWSCRSSARRGTSP